jgi:prefoldin subunit 5
MREQIKNRLESMAAEYRTGQKMLAELQERQASVKLTLTRISGAIQVLEELLQENDPAAETTEIAAKADRRAAA